MTVVLPRSVKNARKRIRTLSPVRPARADALNYFNQINRLNQALLGTTDILLKLIEQEVDGETLASMLETQRTTQLQKYLGVSAIVASNFVKGLDESNKRKVEYTVSSAFGLNRPRTVSIMNVDSTRSTIEKMGAGTRIQAFPVTNVNILDDPFIDAIVQASAIENSQLIVSIAPDFFKLVSQAVAANFRGEEQIGGVSLVERLEEIGGITTRRAQFIARDQTAKLTSTLTKARHEAVGIKRYKWRNSRDERVVGNPSGLYPKGNKGHGNHWDREGVIYSYTKPPSDGNPGQPYNCRCTAEAVLDLDDMDVVFGG